MNDVVDAILEAGVNKNLRGVYNLGSGVGYSLKNVIETIQKKMNPNINLNFGEIPYQENQVMVLHSDITKLRMESNWSPKVSLEEGLDETIKWYHKNE